MAARMAMIAMTMSNSIKVKAGLACFSQGRRCSSTLFMFDLCQFAMPLLVFL
jgi:hypothetical protein